MEQPKKLIEVAMPIKEISAECVRDKSIRQGHISTLHLWWARRPLPVCRAVVFASLIPDPLDENCPQQFRDAIEILLGKENNQGDPYKPYDDIPYTSSIDKMDDNLRNRLMMFIGKFSSNYTQNERLGKSTSAKEQISDSCLIKWDNKNNEEIINKARKLIWVAYNATKGMSAMELIGDFNNYYSKIKDAENILYNTKNRHLSIPSNQILEQKLTNAIESFLVKMPKVFDPFAGGGAIPLEAARLGCKSYGNDINPVAHIIQKAGLEFPQKYGKSIIYSRSEFIDIYGEKTWNNQPNENKIFEKGTVSAIKIENRLAFDVDYYSRKLLEVVESEIGYLYPADDNGKKPIAYYWARVGICSNPICKAEVPLLKNFYLVNSKDRKIYLNPIITGDTITFEIKKGQCEIEGWVARGNMKCPCCGNATDVKTLKKQFIDRITKEKILATIWDGKNGKDYKVPSEREINILSRIPTEVERPSERMPVEYTQALPSCTWGLETWGYMFSNRQIGVMQAFVKGLNILKQSLQPDKTEYNKAVITYLAILIDRLATRNTSFGLWNTIAETLEHPFGRQAIPMVFDYPESNPFTTSTGGVTNQIEWITKYIEGEKGMFYGFCNNASSGDKAQFEHKYLTAVVTDPPYYDAIAYADLSDFFYVWLKRTIGDVYPLNFSTPQTPKSDECTALKHHHGGEILKAKRHFEEKLTQIFSAIEYQTSDIVSIMFAHQSTEAWSTLCNSILNSNMNFTGSWAIDTERSSAGVKTNLAFLSSSVTVSARPSDKNGFGDYKDVRKAIESKVAVEVDELYRLGFRGSDLLTACFGQAVSEFGRYNKVEKADGSEVTIPELLEMARESAFNALLKGFKGDDFTKFYIAWLQLNGFMETDFDDAAKFTKVGLTIDVQDLFKEFILIKSGNKQHLGSLKERVKLNAKIGEGRHNKLIDVAHRAMSLYDSPNRNNLLKFIEANASDPESLVWRVITSLAELLPKDIDDHKLAQGLLTNKDQLIRESKASNTPKTEQARLTFE